MNKHERAVELLRKTVGAYGERARFSASIITKEWLRDGDALTYALRVLEAVEGVEEWMVEQMDIEVDLCGSEGGLRSLWRVVGAHLQAILDAKAAPDA